MQTHCGYWLYKLLPSVGENMISTVLIVPHQLSPMTHHNSALTKPVNKPRIREQMGVAWTKQSSVKSEI